MMKRTLLIVAILALSVAPAMATVTISAIQVTSVGTGANAGTYSRAQGRPCNAIDINYICSAGEAVRAFALDVRLDNGFTFVEVNDFNKGESSTTTKLGYGIFPGSFRDVMNAADPCWGLDTYNPIAPATDADATGTGIGTNRVILELGSLYSGAGNKPSSVGRLCRLYVMPPRIPLDCNLTITVNSTRGGVVLEDGTSVTPTFVARGLSGAGKVSFPECFPCWTLSSSNVGYEPQYTEFLKVWKPNCWCGQYAVADATRSFQCYGDADGKTETLSKFRVYQSDYQRIVACWGKKATAIRSLPNCLCADFDHKAETLSAFRVYQSDYSKLVSNWGKKDTQLKPACPQP